MPAAPLEALAPLPEDLRAMRDLVLDGRTLDAFATARRFAPLEAWTDFDAVQIADWLCDGLGAPQRGRALELRAIRRAPRSPRGRLLRASIVLATRGALEGHRAVQALKADPAWAGLHDEASPETRAELPLLEAGALARLRDFRGAMAALDEAARMGAAPRRVALLEAQILLFHDRFADALGAARRALGAAPRYTNAIAFTAHLHVLLGEADAALALLRASAADTQCATLALHLVMMLDERGLHDERHEWIERWAARVPLLEDLDRLRGLRADSAYDRGDVAGATALARTCKASSFHSRVAAHLEKTAESAAARRTILDVPFVQQHDMTCAPATLTALATYWKMPAEHLEVADAICFDGTPHHNQRTWAEEHGFVARELTATLPAIHALIDRGVPLTVATVEGASAHLLAVVGYDARRGTLFLRDPSHSQRIEALAEEWLETWRATGPQAMVLVPRAEESRLGGIELPDAALYDQLHQANAALGRHDRDAAVAAIERLVAAAPSHRLAVQGRRALAAYDQDPERLLTCAREMAAAFPDFVMARLDALACMRAIRPRSERIAAAEALVAAHPREPLYAEALARELADDAREHGRATRLSLRAIRARPDRYASLALLAQMRWAHNAFDEAIALHRFAACVGRYDEGAVHAYVVAARALGREEEALALVTTRAAELGRRGGAPVMTLFRTLEALGRTDDGLRALDDALRSRPDDGDLLLFAASARASLGEIDVARARLTQAEARAKRADWLRAAADLALRTAAFEERARLLEELLAMEPLDAGAHHAYAGALAARDGSAAARRHLEAAQERAPHLRALGHLLLEWVRGAGAVESERIAQKVLAVDPTDAWTRRELALAQLAQGKLEDARAALDLAEEVAPSAVALARSRAALLQREGRSEEARAALWTALELDPDLGDVITEILAAEDDASARDAALEKIEAIVRARSVTGAGIVAWYLAARPLRDAASMRRSVDEARAERPTHWATWSAAVRHRSFTGEHDAARALAEEACARFPLVAALWTDRADALTAAGDLDAATVALERAVQIDALDEIAHMRLGAAYVRAGAHDRARALLERDIGRSPTHARARAQLADLSWGAGDRDAALRHVEIALAMDADDARAWGLLDEWSTAEGRTTEGLTRIEAFADARPWNGHAMLVLARARVRRNDGNGALAAIDRALAADPLLQDAHDLRATVLAMLGRFDEAKAACAPATYGAAVPRELRGRAAWVRARQGDLAGASEAIRAIVAEHPDYTWGWGMLAAWCRSRGAPEEALEAARQLVRAAPMLAGAHHELAEALFETGDRAAARSALGRAVDLAPSDEGIVTALFDAAMDDGDLPAAEALVPLLRGARPRAGLAAQVRLLAQRGDEAALDALRGLATRIDADAVTIETARRACIVAGLGDGCHALMGELTKDPAAHPSAGAIWIRSLVLRGEAKAALAAMRALDPAIPAVRAAASAWLDVLDESGAEDARREAARAVAARFAPCDDALWSRVARAFLHGALEECVTWTRDWRKRPDATPAMLLDVASALRETARDEAALEVIQHAAPIEPADGGSRSHRAWLAFEHAVRGEAVDARRWLERAGDLANVPVLEGVGKLTEALLVIPEANGRGRPFLRARAVLAEARAHCKYTVLARAHRRAEQRLARDAGFPLGFLWSQRQTLLLVAAIGGGLLLVVAYMAFVSSGSSSSSSSPGSPVPIGLFLFFGIRALIARNKRT